jgi:hypothetical protein
MVWLFRLTVGFRFATLPPLDNLQTWLKELCDPAGDKDGRGIQSVGVCDSGPFLGHGCVFDLSDDL